MSEPEYDLDKIRELREFRAADYLTTPAAVGAYLKEILADDAAEPDPNTLRQAIGDVIQAMHNWIDGQAGTDTARLIGAAEKHAEAYDDDPRDCIKTDVMNGFYAGAAWHAARVGQLADTVAELRKACWPLVLWWAMTEAQEELAGNDPRESIPDAQPILHFMGSGASTRVTAGQVRALVMAVSKIASEQATPEERAYGERVLQQLRETGGA